MNKQEIENYINIAHQIAERTAYIVKRRWEEAGYHWDGEFLNSNYDPYKSKVEISPNGEIQVWDNGYQDVIFFHKSEEDDDLFDDLSLDLLWDDEALDKHIKAVKDKLEANEAKLKEERYQKYLKLKEEFEVD